MCSGLVSLRSQRGIPPRWRYPPKHKDKAQRRFSEELGRHTSKHVQSRLANITYRVRKPWGFSMLGNPWGCSPEGLKRHHCLCRPPWRAGWQRPYLGYPFQTWAVAGGLRQRLRVHQSFWEASLLSKPSKDWALRTKRTFLVYHLEQVPEMGVQCVPYIVTCHCIGSCNLWGEVTLHWSAGNIPKLQFVFVSL
jgi:hypothetical protein